MDGEKRKIDYWYAAVNTEVVLAPTRKLETFGSTVLNYRHIAPLLDDPRRVRIREGRLEAHRPELIMPSEFAKIEADGFGEEARKYLDYLREHEDQIRILQYGYQLKRESFSEQVVTDSMAAVVERVVADVKSHEDPLGAVVTGVDDPWDVSLVKLFWEEVNASAPVNVRELEEARLRALTERTPASLQEEIERAFEKASRDPGSLNELGAFLRAKGVFEQYQDRFFKLIRPDN